MRALIWRDEKKELDIALGDLNEAIRLDPAGAHLWNSRGIAWWAKKEYDRALADYTEALRLDHGYALAYNNRAWLWVTCPDAKDRDGRRAIEAATRACELSGWEEANDIDTLTAAYAAAGDFEAASALLERIGAGNGQPAQGELFPTARRACRHRT
jgi:tetratricopeptide (TPR) repeat protein